MFNEAPRVQELIRNRRGPRSKLNPEKAMPVPFRGPGEERAQILHLVQDDSLELFGMAVLKFYSG